MDKCSSDNSKYLQICTICAFCALLKQPVYNLFNIDFLKIAFVQFPPKK